jgi:hypothetical protein
VDVDGQAVSSAMGDLRDVARKIDEARQEHDGYKTGHTDRSRPPVVPQLRKVLERMERETGIEPATSSLGSLRSTAELLPRSQRL